MSSLPSVNAFGRGTTSGRQRNKYSLSPESRNQELKEQCERKAATFTSASIANSAELQRLSEGAKFATQPPSRINNSINVAPNRSSFLGRLSSSRDTPTALLPNGGTRGLAAGVPAETHAAVSPAELYSAQQASRVNVVDDTWRSRMLHYETDLRELVTEGTGKPPSAKRVARLLKIFDGVSRAMEEESPFVAELMRLFRVEFCRAIFTEGLPSEADAEGSVEEDVQPYFEQVAYVLRENAALSAEVAVGNTQERLAQLLKELESSKDMLKLYESEIGRLTRQNDHLTLQCKRAREEIQKNLDAFNAERRTAERELQSLSADNKDMQLQLFRLRKQVAGGRSKLLKDNYHQNKLTKLDMMTTLFSEGDERIITLVMLSQLENRLNEILDTYDNEFSLTAETMLAECKRKMCDSAVVILEEMHLCERNYRRLVPRRRAVTNTDGTGEEEEEYYDETDGFVGILFDQRIYANLMERDAIKKRLLNVDINGAFSNGESPGNKSSSFRQNASGRDDKVVGSSPPVGDLGSKSARAAGSVRIDDALDSVPALPFPKFSTSGNEQSQNAPQQQSDGEADGMEKVVFLKKKEWVENIFNNEGIEEILRRARNNVAIGRVRSGKIDPDVLMRRINRRPLLDLSESKFHSKISLFCGRDPTQQKLLCNIGYVDPVLPIQLPSATQFVKLKYAMGVEGFSTGDSSHNSRPASRRTVGDTVVLFDASGAASDFNENSVHSKSINERAASQLREWGGKTSFQDEVQKTKRSTVFDDPDDSGLVSLNENLKVFRELGNPKLISKEQLQQKAVGAQSSTTAATVAFQRLDPLSPNRGPEWTLYKALFGGYRSLTPRMLDVTTIDHLFLKACETHFTRMKFRFDQCIEEANLRATNPQMSQVIAERFFRDAYVLSDFQEALVDELEERYGFPEFVAKNFYEMLCYLDASSANDPLMDLYLKVVRGFFPPTQLHFISFMLYNLSFCWPSSNPLEEVSREDVTTVLQYLYRNCEKIIHVDAIQTLKEYEMATRNAPFTLVSLRQFLASSMLHQEEPLLLYLHGLFANFCDRESELSYENYDEVVARYWQPKDEKPCFLRFLINGLGFNRGPTMTTRDLAFIASSCWCSSLWK